MPNFELPTLLDSFLRKIHMGIHKEAECSDLEKVGPMGTMILSAIYEKKEVSIQSIVCELARDKSQLSKKISELERKSLIARRKSETDARVSLLYLTPEGQSYVEELKGTVMSVLSDILHPLSDDERVSLSEILLKLR